MTSADRVTADLGQLGPIAPTAEWKAYRDVHTEIRARDDNGSWDGAVATGTGAGSANAAFAAFDTSLAGTLDEASGAAADDLSALQPGLGVGAVLALLAGLGVALLGRRGVAARLREYR